MRLLAIKILNILAKRIISKYNPVVIGITGSVGKSSARHVIYEMLKKKYKVFCNRSKQKTDINIPLAIIGIDKVENGTLREFIKIMLKAIKIIASKSDYPEILILEMGIERPQDMKKMLDIVKPNIAIMTNFSNPPPHVEYFKSEKHLFREKSLLFKSLGKKDLAVINFDDEHSKDIAENSKSKIATFGFGDKAGIKAEEIFAGEHKWKIENGKTGISFKVFCKGTTVPFRIPYVIGRGYIYAVLAAVAVGEHLKMNLVEMSETLSKYNPLAGRMKLIKGIRNSMIIDDSFGASPSSTMAALETFEKVTADRKILILGDMLELGEYRETGNKIIGKKVPESADLLFAFGENSRIVCKEAKKNGMAEDKIFYFENMDELIGKIKETIKSDDIILIKGSREMRMERVVKEIMNDPEKADELLVK